MELLSIKDTSDLFTDALALFLARLPPLVWVVPAQIMDYNNLRVYPLQSPCLISLYQAIVFKIQRTPPLVLAPAWVSSWATVFSGEHLFLHGHSQSHHLLDMWTFCAVALNKGHNLFRGKFSMAWTQPHPQTLWSVLVWPIHGQRCSELYLLPMYLSTGHSLFD